MSDFSSDGLLPAYLSRSSSVIRRIRTSGFTQDRPDYGCITRGVQANIALSGWWWKRRCVWWLGSYLNGVRAVSVRETGQESEIGAVSTSQRFVQPLSIQRRLDAL